MTNELESITRRILEEYERVGQVDSKTWLSRHPRLANELASFLLLLDGSPRQSRVHQEEEWADDRSVATDAFNAAWAPTNLRLSEERDIALAAAVIRSQAPGRPIRANKQFQRAAVLSWVVCNLVDHRDRVTRLATQKTLYLVERVFALGIFDRFQVMPLGPYDSTARYKDAEPIAQRKRWIVESGAELRCGPSNRDSHAYAQRYVRSPVIVARLVKLLATLSDEQLETWATVDAAAVQLLRLNHEVTIASIIDRLRNNATWEPKLHRSHFSAPQIGDALFHLQLLGVAR